MAKCYLAWKAEYTESRRVRIATARFRRKFFWAATKRAFGEWAEFVGARAFLRRFIIMAVNGIGRAGVRHALRVWKEKAAAHRVHADCPGQRRRGERQDPSFRRRPHSTKRWYAALKPSCQIWALREAGWQSN